jgi:hypothetical protein
MKYSKLAGLLSGTAMAFFLSSCGGNGVETKTQTDSATVDTVTAVAPVVSTIVTTPENLLVVMHKVVNYAKWKTGYDAHDSVRLAHGVHSYVIGRGFLDSNMIMVALKIDDTAKAMAFIKDPGLKTLMQKIGVVGKPVASFLTEIWQDTVTIESKLRSRTTFMVKDWDAWLKAFNDGKQERLDNGITVRVIGHDINDNKKVSLVTAITDTAKAFAYFKSDALKKRRAESGVIGEPARFLFQIVARYK